MAGQNRKKGQVDNSLPFERKIMELEQQLEDASTDEERERLREELDNERAAVFSKLMPWQRVLLARHPARPRMLDYTERILDDFIEIRGDRALGDDCAMVTGIGRFESQTVMIVGQQKGVSTEEKVQRNFGMAHPEGYRKALRAFELAERLHIPVITLVDTPAAHPGVEAEQHGQGPIIAKCLHVLAGLKTPVFCAILGEGGSGGALAVAVGDWIAMFENAIYVICPPERCAEILWRDVERKELAAAALKITAADLKSFDVIDVILREPNGGAHRSPDDAAEELRKEIRGFLSEANKGAWTTERRREKFRRMGVWHEAN